LYGSGELQSVAPVRLTNDHSDEFGSETHTKKK